MARRNITYNGYDLHDSGITIFGINGFENSMRQVNLQGFVARDGGAVTSTQFTPKQIDFIGYLKADSGPSLDNMMDSLKKNLHNVTEKDLVIDYIDGTRRYVATCQDIVPNRENWTIDYMEFTLTFICSNPPFGKDTGSSTIYDTGLTNTYASTTTGEHTGSVSHNGTIPPFDVIRFEFVAIDGFKKLNFQLTNSDGFVTNTRIDSSDTGGKLQDGDVIEINIENGKVFLNGSEILFSGGLPKFTLEGNSYLISLAATSYNVDVRFRYNALWL